jgi:hypothetical protein
MMTAVPPMPLRVVKFSLLAVLPLIVALAVTSGLSAKITESQFKAYRSAVLSRIIEDNADDEKNIRTVMNSTLLQTSARIRLIDKFAIFYSDLRKKGITIKKSRFAMSGAVFFLFFIFEDEQDSQQYTLYLEYEYRQDKRASLLKEIYFSVVFAERMKELQKFFMSR